MQPKSFIIRMARKRKTIEPEPKAVSRNRDISMSTIASRMRVSAVCENHDPLVSLEAIASQMRQGAIYDGTSRGASRATPQPAVAAWEHPESRSLSENSSLSEPPSTITSSGRSSPQDEDETPRSRKRKRQPPKLPTTPSSSTRTTPAHSPSTVATSPRSHNVARKIQSLRLESPSPTTDENLETLSRPRLRSEAKINNANRSSQVLRSNLATLRAQLANEKREKAKLKAQAAKDKDNIDDLRAGLKALRSEFDSEKLENSKMKQELATFQADLERLQYKFGGELGGDNSVNPETREGLAQIVNMNEMLRRVIQGERVYRDEMYGKLHSLRKKVGPLLAKVDGLDQTVEEIKVHLGAHDAPIELIMDFVRNFHQWWVDRYNARHQGGSTEPTDAPQP